MKRTTHTRLAAGLVAGVMAFTACGSDGNDANVADTEAAESGDAGEESAESEGAAEVGTIVDVAVEAGTFETLVAAVTAADLAETLSGEGPFTVFAPTDDAFAALPDGLVDALLLPENKDALVAILTYHVLGSEVPSSDVATGAVATVQGEEIDLVAGDDGVTVNGANVIAVDVEASNGVIHVIDSVLVPPSIDPAALLADDAGEESAESEGAAEVGTIVDVAVEAGSFETLVAAVTAADLAETLSGEGPFTVFAPTDDAFAALPVGLVDALLLPENKDALVAILTYHVLGSEVPSSDVATGAVATVQGEEIDLVAGDDGVTVNGANVIAVDVEASNGVIHVIDSVLVPPSIDPAALLADDAGEESAESEGAAEVGTIVDVAVEAGTFETLVAAVTAADLAETLSGEGPFTVFAPTDDAFAALPDGLVDALLLPENKDTLAKILTYHVVSGSVMAADVTDGDVETVEGQTVELAVGEGVTVNGANVIIADVAASNGVIHAIDAVLLPPDVDPAALLG